MFVYTATQQTNVYVIMYIVCSYTNTNLLQTDNDVCVAVSHDTTLISLRHCGIDKLLIYCYAIFNLIRRDNSKADEMLYNIKFP